MINSTVQAKFLAATLLKQSRMGNIEKLIPVYQRSGIEVFPHQIAAAHFAVSNPMRKGYILCDEVGLGKAVEAMLVISQYYFSGKQKIAVVVPVPLLADWQNIIEKQFGLPCAVIQKADDLKNMADKIALLSYGMASELGESIKIIHWDLAVFEEAHRLRKFYTGENQKEP